MNRDSNLGHNDRLPGRYDSFMTDSITIIRPDDWHLHLRDRDYLRAVLPDTASGPDEDAPVAPPDPAPRP